jgi:peptidoglycan/xylan/chitin deacetylase (PgdA/CDA1 family)
LLYHDVFAESPRESGFGGGAAEHYKLSLTTFEGQLRRLGDVLDDPPLLVTGPRDLAGHGVPVALTVDDGGVSYHSLVAQRLEARGWRGHCFVTTDCIGRRGFLHKHHLRELHARGHVIGSHSVTHPGRFAACAPEEMLREWRESRSTLQDILGAEITTASVPGGYFSLRVARAAATAGLKALFTSEPEIRVREICGCTVLGRFAIRRGDSLDHPARLVARAPGARSGAWLAWNGKKALKALLGPGYAQLAGRFVHTGR